MVAPMMHVIRPRVESSVSTCISGDHLTLDLTNIQPYSTALPLLGSWGGGSVSQLVWARVRVHPGQVVSLMGTVHVFRMKNVRMKGPFSKKDLLPRWLMAIASKMIYVVNRYF